jgi:hypothetical protein
LVFVGGKVVSGWFGVMKFLDCGWQVVVVMGIRGANQEMQMAALLDELG